MCRRKSFYLFLLLLVFSISVNAQKIAEAQEWKSIVTLKTTRAELENRFGTSGEGWGKGAMLYELEDFNLLVIYSNGCTGDKNADYDVPPDTVLIYTVYLKEKMPLSAMNIDRTKFKKTVYPPGVYLENEDQGVTYRISNDEHWIIKISYRPKKADYKLVCQKKSDK